MSIDYSGKTRQAFKVNRKSRLTHLGSTGVLLAMLAGCSQTGTQGLGLAPSTYQQRHPIVVESAPTTLDIPVGEKRTHLTAAMKSAITGFAYDYRRARAKGVEILVPSGSSNEASAAHITRHVKEVLNHNGIPSRHISVRSYSALSPEQAAHIRLSYSAISAHVASECGVWPSDVGFDTSNTNYHNFGCATQSNLASIVADPNDLIAPRDRGTINAERASIIVDDFEANAVSTVAPVAVSDAL